MSAQDLDVETVAGRSTIWIDSDKIEECIEYYSVRQVDFVGVSPSRGYRASDLEFLRSFNNIQGLKVVHPPIAFDLSPIEALKGLKMFINSGPPVPLALDHFPKLQEFRGYWHKYLPLAACKTLKILDLSGYRPKSKTLEEFPALQNLIDLSIVQANTTSLLGISRLKTVRQLNLAHMRYLKSLKDVNKLEHLEVLCCEKCRNVEDHDLVAGLKELRILRLNDCGQLRNIRFLDDMPRLEEFRFVGSNVMDGDLGPLLRLKRVGFFAKKHYSHTPAQIKAAIDSAESVLK